MTLSSCQNFITEHSYVHMFLLTHYTYIYIHSLRFSVKVILLSIMDLPPSMQLFWSASKPVPIWQWQSLQQTLQLNILQNDISGKLPEYNITLSAKATPMVWSRHQHIHGPGSKFTYGYLPTLPQTHSPGRKSQLPSKPLNLLILASNKDLQGSLPPPPPHRCTTTALQSATIHIKVTHTPYEFRCHYPHQSDTHTLWIPVAAMENAVNLCKWHQP